MDPVYRIVPARDWPAIQATGGMSPSPLDQQDGFIHLSDADTVLATADRFFPPSLFPIVLEIDAHALGDDLRREYVEDREAIFPHLYRPALPLEAITGLYELLHEGGQYRWGKRVDRAAAGMA